MHLVRGPVADVRHGFGFIDCPQVRGIETLASARTQGVRIGSPCALILDLICSLEHVAGTALEQQNRCSPIQCCLRTSRWSLVSRSILEGNAQLLRGELVVRSLCAFSEVRHRFSRDVFVHKAHALCSAPHSALRTPLRAAPQAQIGDLEVGRSLGSLGSAWALAFRHLRPSASFGILRHPSALGEELSFLLDTNKATWDIAGPSGGIRSQVAVQRMACPKHGTYVDLMAPSRDPQTLTSCTVSLPTPSLGCCAHPNLCPNRREI